jgi:acetylornithine deacetylase
MDYRLEVENWIQKNDDKIIQTLSELIQIKTENIPPGGNEKPGQEYLYNEISKFIPEKDIDVFDIDTVENIREHPLFFPTIDGIDRDYKNRPNIVAKLKGEKGEKSLAFSGHMDVMPVKEKEWEVFKDPFSGRIKEGKMYGRGSMDMKSGMLAGFMAVKCIKELGVKLIGDLYAESLIDEENGGVNGTLAARCKYPYIDFAILSEPSDLIVGIETIGGSDWKVNINVGGPGGFGFNEELENPIYKLSKIALALEKYNTRLKKTRIPVSFQSGQFLKLLTFQFFSGGSSYMESGAVPIEGHLYFWLEAFADMTEEKYRKDFLGFMRKELQKYDEFKDDFPSFETVIRYLGGHRTNKNHPLMQSIKRAYKILDLEYKESGLGIASDAFAFRKASNTDVVILGPKGGNAHGLDEWVDIDSFFKIIKIMTLTAIDYCG